MSFRFVAPSSRPSMPMTGCTRCSFNHPRPDVQPSFQSSFTSSHRSFMLEFILCGRSLPAGPRSAPGAAL
eukprot:CAMPEP_0206248574 /NCGR_PEP_ID=MMETSP0047_2-20121206/20443_1 /ASSEMBLY_ACC=CAM_ASM_000192 /TAXON_ID=195065 /ORGANISM="Chroomonas mesostigmatica_cf, Strain CCMP1168" /LENGTH=69 /DNA_ID=CAMNT_0053674229 /DNA_START=297 /DNA_END=509 /DNA_ORIENTATION=+